MTCRLNFNKRFGRHDGSSEAYQATASMRDGNALVKAQNDEIASTSRRPSRAGRAALSLSACGRVEPRRPSWRMLRDYDRLLDLNAPWPYGINIRHAWGLGHAPREVAWLLNPPAFEGRRLWWKPGCVVRVVGR